MWFFLFLAAALGLTAIGLRSSSTPTGVKPIASRKAMSLADLPELGGGHWRLADHHGQVVLINYWATWCGPCQEELPGLLGVARDYTPKGLAMVGISMDVGADAATKVRQFADRFHLPYPVAFPAQNWFSDPGVMALPTTVLLDRQGRIAKTYQGAVAPEALTRDITALLSEP